MPIHYPAQGHTIVDGVYVEQFYLDGGGQPTFMEQFVAFGQAYEAGEVLGKITATGILTKCDPAAGDGSETPFAILMEDLDLTAAAANEEVSVLTTSNRTINFKALVFNAAWDKKELRAALSLRGIQTRTQMYSAI